MAQHLKFGSGNVESGLGYVIFSPRRCFIYIELQPRHLVVAFSRGYFIQISSSRLVSLFQTPSYTSTYCQNVEALFYRRDEA